MGDKYSGHEFRLNTYCPSDEEATAMLIAGCEWTTAEDTETILEALGILAGLRARWAGRVVATTEPRPGRQAGDMAGS